MYEEEEEPGVLYRDPATPAGYLGWYVVDREGVVVLRLEVREAKLTDESCRKIDELRHAIADPPGLRLIG